jgi:ubiquinone/menaquinone biosynthesis C-methylase UbiE
LNRYLEVTMLSDEEKLQRSKSFGEAAHPYDRFRPRPPRELLAWIFPRNVERVLDLGAGTGVASASLAEFADEVIAVEPDDAMRAVLEERLPYVTAVKGTGENMPLADNWVDALVASTSWHWVEPVQGLAEIRRVVKPGGVFSAFWVGPDPEGAFLAMAANALSTNSDQSSSDEILDTSNRIDPVLRIAEGSGFGPIEQKSVRWDIALNAEDLLGLLGTMSWILTMSEEKRQGVFVKAREALTMLGIVGDTTVDVQYLAEGFKATRL